MDLNEAQTRAARIDEQLDVAGWGAGAQRTDFEVEYAVAGLSAGQQGFADYALVAADGSVLAIVEAKRASRDALAGKEQAREYVAAIEARSGERPFVYLANGNEIWFWDTGDNPRKVSGFASRADLERKVFQRDHRQPLSGQLADTSIVDRDYQLLAVEAALDAIEQGRRRVLLTMATGTGKTRVACAIVEMLLRFGWAQKILFVADRDALVQQALADGFGMHLPQEPAERIKSSTFDGSKRLYVATIHTMADFHREISPAAFDVVIVDECHRSIYNRWQEVVDYFDAHVIGLTATPADFVDRNTFLAFDCPLGQPTFEYSYETAVRNKYLVPFEVYHSRTRFQVAGIRGRALSPSAQEELEAQGLDPDDIDFAGTEIEKRVTNRDTLRLHVREFFETAITDPSGMLPGKSIIFALNHGHAKRLWETFVAEYPQFPGLVEIIDSHMERAPALIERFKRQDSPRIAISVDMLDTGLDVPTIVNLGFAKPVFSRIKFWQMIGRGTRTVDTPRAAKPWCPSGTKDRFRIIDFWDNFERFQLNPDGVEPSASTAVATRKFRALVKVAQAAQRARSRLDLSPSSTEASDD